MPLTPLDIESRNFKRELAGYSRREVDDLLRNAADALSQVNLEREELARLLSTARHEVDEYRSREKTLIEALAAAERLTEERRENAQREADRMLGETRAKVERMIIDAREQSERLAAEAREQAEKMQADARLQAETLLQRTRAELSRIEQQIVRLKVERETFENKLVGLIDEHRRLIEIRRQEAGLDRPRATVGDRDE